MNNFKYVRGPVKSRRLNLSLGIDLFPKNICSEDCIYCECGKTERLTAVRDEYTDTEEVITELQSRIKDNPECDYVTFSGRGEPTLHSSLGRIIDFISEEFPDYDIAVLTNSTLLHRAEVREELANADLLVPSLDAGSSKTFNKICRPAPGIEFENIVEGLKKATKSFAGKVFLEILLLSGLNDSEEEINNISDILYDLHYDRIDLNTLDRPPAEKYARKMKEKSLEEIAQKLPGRVKIFN